MVHPLSLKQVKKKLPQWGQLGCCSVIVAVALAAPVKAQNILGCRVVSENDPSFTNQARFGYLDVNETEAARFSGQSNPLTVNVTSETVQVETIATGVLTANGERVVGLGTLIDGLTPKLEANNFSPEAIEAVGSAAVSAVARLSDTSSLQGAIEQVKSKMIEAVDEEAQEQAIVNLPNGEIAALILGFNINTLQAMGLDQATAEEISELAINSIGNISDNRSVQEVLTQSSAEVSNALTSEERSAFTAGRRIWLENLEKVRQGESNLKAGDTLTYHFTLENPGQTTAEVTIPNLQTLKGRGMRGRGRLQSVSYSRQNEESKENGLKIGQEAKTIRLEPNETIEIVAEVTIQNRSENARVNQVGFGLGADCGEGVRQQTIAMIASPQELGDPFGRVTGCRGEILPDYSGFTIGLYEPGGGPPGSIGPAIELTRTELPDDPSNQIPEGIEPNTENSNPFFLTNEDQGRYSFLLDETRGQLDKGDTYILLVNPSEESTYGDRRIRIEIGEVTDNAIPLTATSLDGQPINLTDPLERTVIEATLVRVPDAETFGLNLAVLNFQAGICRAQEIDLDKFADRAAAEIGDIVIYRLNIRNLSEDPVDTFTVTDTLPRGINFISDSVRSGIGEEEIEVEVNQDDRTVEFAIEQPGVIPSGDTLNIIYGAEVTPDAQRGSGINTADVEATVFNRTVRDGPVTQELEIRPGLLNDCGTLIGKVFVDKNFDGEQQPGEPGVPNAVIYLENGTRISTDADGQYSLQNVCPGYHTAIVDFTSIPGYELAPSPKRREKQSPSRLFQMSPGGMVRVNFGVTPTGGEEK